MDDLRYQVDLLTALNQKLKAEERMYRLFFDTSMRAFLYINYENGTAETLGNFNKFFDFTINEAARLPELGGELQAPYFRGKRRKRQAGS